MSHKGFCTRFHLVHHAYHTHRDSLSAFYTLLGAKHSLYLNKKASLFSHKGFCTRFHFSWDFQNTTYVDDISYQMLWICTNGNLCAEHYRKFHHQLRRFRIDNYNHCHRNGLLRNHSSQRQTLSKVHYIHWHIDLVISFYLYIFHHRYILPFLLPGSILNVNW